MANERTLLSQMEQGQTLTSWLGSTSSTLGTLKLQGLLNPNDFKNLECKALKLLNVIKNFDDSTTTSFDKDELKLLHEYASNVVEILASRRQNYYISSNFSLGVYLESDLPSIRVHFHVFRPKNSPYVLVCPKEYDSTKLVCENILFLIPPELFVSFFPNGCSLKFNNSHLVHPALKSFLNLRMSLRVTYSALNVLLSSAIESLYFPIRFMSLIPNDISSELLSFIMSILASRPGDTYQSILSKFFNIIHSYGMIEELKRNGNYLAPDGRLTSGLQQWNILADRFYQTLNTMIHAMPLNETSAKLNLNFTSNQFSIIFRRFPFGAIRVKMTNEKEEKLEWLLHCGADFSSSNKRTFLFTYDLNNKQIDMDPIPNDLSDDVKGMLHHPTSDQMTYIQTLIDEFDKDVELKGIDLIPAGRMSFASNVFIREFNQALPDILPANAQRIILGDREIIILYQSNEFLSNLLIQAGYRSALNIELPSKIVFNADNLETVSVQSNMIPNLEMISNQNEEIDRLSDRFNDLQQTLINLGDQLQSLKLNHKSSISNSKHIEDKTESITSSICDAAKSKCTLHRDDDFILTNLEKSYGALNEIECQCTSVSKITVGGLIDMNRSDYYCLQCESTWAIKDLYRDLKLHDFHGKFVLSLTTDLTCDAQGWKFADERRENPIGRLPSLLIVPYKYESSDELKEQMIKKDSNNDKSNLKKNDKNKDNQNRKSNDMKEEMKNIEGQIKKNKSRSSSGNNKSSECEKKNNMRERCNSSSSSIKSGKRNDYDRKRPDESAERLLDDIIKQTDVLYKKLEKESILHNNSIQESSLNDTLKENDDKKNELEWHDVDEQKKKKKQSQIVWSIPSAKLGQQQHQLYEEFKKLKDEKERVEWFLKRFLPIFIRFQSPKDSVNLCYDLYDSTKFFGFGILLDCLREYSTNDVEKDLGYKVPSDILFNLDDEWIGICSELDQPEIDYSFQIGYKYQTYGISAYTMKTESPLNELLNTFSKVCNSVHPDVIVSVCIVLSAILQAGVLISDSSIQGLYSYTACKDNNMPNVMLDLASGSLAAFQ